MMYQNNQPAETARLEDYIQAISLRKWLVAALTVLGVMLATLFATSRQPTYTAEASVQVRPTPVGSVDPTRDASVSIETERKVIESDKVKLAVIEAVGGDLSRDDLSVEYRPDSFVLDIEFKDPSAQRATDVVNAFATKYAEEREIEANAYLLNQIFTASGTLQVAESSRDELASQIGQEQAKAAPNEALVRRLESDLRATEEIIDQANQEIAAANGRLSPDLRPTDLSAPPPARPLSQACTANASCFGAEVLSKGSVPTSPDGLTLPMLIAAGLVGGLLIGIVAAFLVERLDTTARDDEDVALALGASVMGTIPTLGIGHRSGSNSLIMLSSGGSSKTEAAREAFRRLRSSIQFLNSSSGVSSIIVTSAISAEGKSLTSANLSVALAQNGSRTVLVGADLRRPTIGRLFGMESSRPGLSEYLGNAAELNAEKVPGIENLWIIRAGIPPANPGELLNSDRFEQMIKELERENVEYIVIDTPPVLSTADAVSAARYVDGVIVVVDSERTETTDLLQVRADLARSGSRLLGAVMNRQRLDKKAGRVTRDAYYR